MRDARQAAARIGRPAGAKGGRIRAVRWAAALLTGAVVATATPATGPVPLAGQSAFPERGTLEEARWLLDAHMPVSAGSLLARELSRGRIEGDEAVLLTARAYVDQRAWSQTRRLLAGRELAGPAARSEGAYLLARAYAGLDSAARAAALFADALAASPTPSLELRVGLAEALGEAGDWIGAAEELRRAAGEAPELARWFHLSRLYALAEADDPRGLALADSLARAPGLPADSALLPAARLAFELGDPATGAALAERAGSDVRAALAVDHLAPWLLARGDSSGAARAYRGALDRAGTPAEAGAALLAIDRSWETLRDVGRSDLRAGRRERAARYLEVALDLAPEEEKPDIADLLASALAALGEPGRALEALGPWLESPRVSAPERASIWLTAARLYAALGRESEADRAYERAASGSGDDAAYAAYLIADAYHDEGRLEEAAAAFERAYAGFSGSSYGSRSLERLALLDYHEGRFGDAAERLDEYRRRYPRGRWVQGSLYWSGKAAEARGDTSAARALYRRTVAYDPLDYYAILAAPRAGVDRWERLGLREEASSSALHPIHAAALERMNRLRDMGWVERARREYREARAAGPSDPARALAFARALNEAGWTREGIAEGWRARSGRGSWSRAQLEAIYPLPFREALAAAARERGLPVHFVAGLSRRESMFDPEILSVANAVGLMQLLPQTARDVAPRAGLPEYRRAQLTVPEVNLLLGTRYLADVLERFGGSPVAGMISYNAGPHRYARWREFPEFADPEQLVERIPFRETREYVRAVTELSEIYRFLYPDLEPLAP